MSNTAKKTQYGIKIDFEKSKGSYLHDKITGHEFLDFFGMYATLALGYNHDVFKSNEFKNRMLNIVNCKIVNNEILSDEAEMFDEKFTNLVSLNGKFSHFHYTCTGALAIEAAIKTAIDYKSYSEPEVISFNESFHGINGYGGFLTTREGGAGERLNGFPGPFSKCDCSWPVFDNPVITYNNGNLNENIVRVEKVLNDVENYIKSENSQVAGILVEPIQCTFGDHYYSENFFIGLREISTKYDVPLIFDEIQVGFGGTGKIWYFEHLPIEPDIVVFGKKVQVAGIMVKQKFTKIFQKPHRLEVTWDGDIVDMLRCEYIINAYKEYNILGNVSKMSNLFIEGLKKTKNLKNIRNSGLLIAFELPTENMRNDFVEKLYFNKMLCNKAMEKTVRFRPNLAVDISEIQKALEIIYHVDETL